MRPPPPSPTLHLYCPFHSRSARSPRSSPTTLRVACCVDDPLLVKRDSARHSAKREQSFLPQNNPLPRGRRCADAFSLLQPLLPTAHELPRRAIAAPSAASFVGKTADFHSGIFVLSCLADIACPPPCAPCWPAGFFSVLAGACQFGTAWVGFATNSPTTSTIIRLVTWLSGLEVHGSLRSTKTIAVSGSAVSSQSCRHLVGELKGRINCAASGYRAKT